MSSFDPRMSWLYRYISPEGFPIELDYLLQVSPLYKIVPAEVFSPEVDDPAVYEAY